MKQYRLYWRNGETETVEGHDITDAFKRAGYGAGSTAALEFFDVGSEQRYIWNKIDHQWLRHKD